jgi:glucose-6-phosphate dehydrogenase assembly protein OpcA
MSADASALFDGPTVKFAEAATARSDGGVDAPSRALMTTVVAIGPLPRLEGAAGALLELGRTSAVRGIAIAYGSGSSSEVRTAGNTIAVSGLEPQYVNNAVAALRLSSLPTFVLWCGGPPDLLDGIVDLADRVVLDAEEPLETWRRAAPLFDRAAFSDLRWSRLTRWRALMAHFFDMPSVRAETASFRRLVVAGADQMTLRLFAEWLRTSVGWGDNVAVELVDRPGAAPIAEVQVEGPQSSLGLRLAGSGTCVESTCSVAGQPCASRTVGLGRQRLTALVQDELRVRSRDAAFERTIRAILTP